MSAPRQPPPLRVAGLQVDIAWEDPPASFARIRPWIAAAAAAGARLVVLPEMFACGFSMRTDRLAEPEGGPSTRFLAEEAGRHGIHICGSLPERREGADRPANTLVLAAPDGSLRRYRKLHPFRFAREHEHYEAGAELACFEVEGVRLTPFICYDLRFANAFWEAAPRTDAYVVIANWPEGRREHWRALLRARAIENQAYMVGVNRVGQGGSLAYAGDSAIIDPEGQVLQEASRQEALLLADLDPGRVAGWRAQFPALLDRRSFPGGPSA
jgi:predicted amidohydrolase